MLFLRRRREQRRSFPRRRAGRRTLFSIFLIRCWSKGQGYPLSQRKSNFLFLRVLRSMGRQCAMPCFLTLAQDPSCQHPRECSSVTQYLPTYLWPVPFGTQGVRLGCLRTRRLLYHPALLPFAAPPQVRRLRRWSRLHGFWRRGSHRPARLTGSRAQFDSATRFSSPGDLPSSTAFSRLRWQSGTPLSCERRLLSSWQGCNRAGPSSRDQAGVSQPLLYRTLERWSPTNPGSASLEPGFAQAPVQDADMQAHDQMHPAPGLVCSDRPEGHLHSCFDPSATQTVPTFCVRGSGMAVQGPPLRALTVSPCLYEGYRGRPYPAMGSGHQGPQLPRQSAYLGPIRRAVVRSQGIGASSQLGKEQALPCAENLFSRCGVRLCEYDGTPHGRACPSSAELPKFLQRQECGTTETFSEAPGAYGIRSCSHAAQVASYEITSALAILPSLGALGLWTGPRLLWHINCLELLTVYLALWQFRPLLLAKHVLVRMDNTAVVSTSTDWELYDHTACHSLPAIFSSGVTCSSSHCVLSTSRGTSIVRPTRSHDSSRPPESDDSIPRRSG